MSPVQRIGYCHLVLCMYEYIHVPSFGGHYSVINNVPQVLSYIIQMITISMGNAEKSPKA